MSHPLLAILKDDLSNTKSLLDTIRQEKDILITGKPTDIQVISEKKQVLATQFSETAQQRNEILSAGGFPQTLDGLETFIQQTSDNEKQALQQVWLELKEYLYQCRQENLINGGIIAGGAHTVQHLLNIISGRDNNNNQATYGPDGITQYQQNSKRHTEI